jgi:hypothetical protein
LIQAAPLEGVVDFARAVRGQDHERRLAGANRPELGNRDLKLRQELEQVSFEFLIGPIDLVDQQDRGPRSGRVDGLQQRPFDEERICVQLAPGRRAIDGLRGLEDPELEELAWIIPFVDGVADVEAFVALQTNQVGAECAGDGGRERRLPDSRFAFKEQRTAKPKRQKERHRETVVGHIMLACQALLQLRDGRRNRCHLGGIL